MAKNGNGDLSQRLIEGLAQESKPLPQSVERTQVRALHREQLIRLVRELTADEAKRLAQIEDRLRSREREWQSRVMGLEAELAESRSELLEAQATNQRLNESRDSTTRYELPRLANLVDEERKRADEETTRAEQLEQELILLEERVVELEGQLEAQASRDDKDEDEGSGGVDRVAVLQQHVDRLQAQLADREAGASELSDDALASEVERLRRELKERDGEMAGLRQVLSTDATTEGVGTRQLLEQALHDYALAEERSARLTALEEVVWELERGNETSGAWRRAIADLRTRHEEGKRETGAQLRAARAKEQELERTVDELKRTHELEVSTLMARHTSASEALDALQDQLEAAQAQLGEAADGRARAREAWDAAEAARTQAEAELADARRRAEEAVAAAQAQEASAPADDAEGDEAERLRAELAELRQARGQAEEELATADEALQAAELELIHTKRALTKAEGSQERTDTARRKAEFDATSQAQEVERLRRLLEEAHGKELERTLQEAATALDPSSQTLPDDESDGSTPKLPGEVLDQAAYRALKEELEDERDRANELALELETAQLLLAQNTETLECELAAVRGALSEAQAGALTGAPTEEGVAPSSSAEEVSVVRRAYHDARSEADRLEREADRLRTALSESRAAEAALTWRQEALEEALEARLEAAESVYAELQERRAPEGPEPSDELGRSQAELAATRAALAESREAVEALQARLAAATEGTPGAATDALRAELNEVRAELARALDERDAEAATAITNLQAALASVALDRDATADALAPDAVAAHAALEASQEALRRLEEELESARQALVDAAEADAAEAVEAEVSADAVDAAVELAGALEAVQAQLAEREARLADVELELAVVRGTLQGAQEAAKALRERVKRSSELESELESVRQTSQALEGELEVARSVLAERESTQSELSQALEAATEEREQLTQRLAALSAEAETDTETDTEDAERTYVLQIEVPPEESNDDPLILDEAPLEGTFVETLEMPAPVAPADELKGELVALRLELARSHSARESLEEQLSVLTARLEASTAGANEQTPSPPYSAEEHAALRVRAEGAEQEHARLESEIHDLERLLESETWRGLATHRDLVRAHQRLRQVEEDAAIANARVIELEGLRVEAEPLDVARVHDVAAREAFSAAFDADGEGVTDEERHEAIRWLLATSPSQQEFLREEAGELLPDLTRRETDTRRLLRVAREDFQAQRKNLLEDVLTTERAVDQAESVGVQPDELSKKSRRATERLRSFDTHLEVELRTLEEQLQDDQDNRHWLTWELGGGHTAREGDGEPETRVPVHLEAQIDDLRKRYADEAQRRHETEREAMQALQAAEQDRVQLEQDLASARQELERLLGQRDERASSTAASRLRLEEQVRELETALSSPHVISKALFEDPAFVRQAERLALLSYQVDEKDSLVHWLLKELDPEYRSRRALLAQDCADVVEGLETDDQENGNGERRADLLHWLIVEAVEQG